MKTSRQFPDVRLRNHSEAQAKKSNGKPAVSNARAEEVLRLLKGTAKHDPEKWFSQKEITGLVGGPFNEIRDNQDTFRRAVSRVLAMLHKAGSIEKNADGAYRCASPVVQIEGEAPEAYATLH